MTGTKKFLYEREAIRQALEGAEIGTVLFNKDEVPRELPAAIVILDGETGVSGTIRRYIKTQIAWVVYLIVNAQGADDPDSALYELKEAFREKYQEALYRDLPVVEYYTSRVDGARLVRIAKIRLLKSGEGAGA